MLAVCAELGFHIAHDPDVKTVILPVTQPPLTLISADSRWS